MINLTLLNATRVKLDSRNCYQTHHHHQLLSYWLPICCKAKCHRRLTYDGKLCFVKPKQFGSKIDVGLESLHVKRNLDQKIFGPYLYHTWYWTKKALLGQFLGVRAPLRIARVKKKEGWKSFEIAWNLLSPASTCTLVPDSPR